MADRSGTFLSDDNIRTMCPDRFPPPGGKSRFVFSHVDKQGIQKEVVLNQRPQNPAAMFRELQKKGIDQGSAQDRYHSHLVQDFTNVMVIPPPAQPRQAAQPRSRTSRGAIIASQQPPYDPARIPTASSSGGPSQSSVSSLSSGPVTDPFGLAPPSQRTRTTAVRRFMQPHPRIKQLKTEKLATVEAMSDPEVAQRVMHQPQGTLQLRSRAVESPQRAYEGAHRPGYLRSLLSNIKRFGPQALTQLQGPKPEGETATSLAP
jgi:hypothetical protein